MRAKGEEIRASLWRGIVCNIQVHSTYDFLDADHSAVFVLIREEYCWLVRLSPSTSLNCWENVYQINSPVIQSQASLSNKSS